MRLYARPLAVESSLAIAALDEADVDFELEWASPGPILDHVLELHPLGKLPLLESDSALICGSLVIARWVENTAKNAWGHPTSARQAAQRTRVSELAVDDLAPAAFEMFSQFALGPAMGLDGDQELGEQAWEWIGSPQPRLAGRSRIDALETAIAKLPSEDQSSVNIGTIAVAAMAIPLVLCEQPLTAWPTLAATVAAMHARPSFRDQLDELGELLTGSG